MKKYVLLLQLLITLQVFGIEPEKLYHESRRPQFHITARQWEGYKLNPARGEDGWLNDLNGLVFYDGEYHVFAQRFSQAWLHWVSRDLIHWTEMKPIFKESVAKWTCVQSGSIVIDKNNSSGLGTHTSIAPMVAFFSSCRQLQADNTVHAVQCMAFSNDKGRTWTEYDKNPVIKDAERDPKVFWYEPQQKWVMIFWGPPGGYHLYSSQDLKNWQKMSYLPDYFECPDMFELALDGDKNNKKWVVVNGDGTYVAGRFDGTTFTPETRRTPLCGGPNYYATQTFNNTEEADGRRIQLAWMKRDDWPEYFNYPADMPFNQQMTFPCELILKSYQGTMRLFRTPIKEIDTLHLKEHKWDSETITGGKYLTLPAGDLFHLKATLEMTDKTELEIRFHGETIRIANGKIGIRERDLLFMNPKDEKGNETPIPLKDLEVLFDKNSIEVFGNNGEVSLSAVIQPTSNEFTVICLKGEVNIHHLSVFEMDSIWKGMPIDL